MKNQGPPDRQPSAHYIGGDTAYLIKFEDHSNQLKLRKLLIGSLALCLVYLSGLPLSHATGNGIASSAEFSKSILSESPSASEEWLLDVPEQTLVSGIFEQDYNALVALYNATGGANWTNNTGWLQEGVDVANWYGVAVSQNRVTYVYSANNNLSGVLPAEIGNLTGLQYLDFNNNQLIGAIPVEIGNLSGLISLLLGGNQLSGTIPVEIGNLSSLQYLSFSNNQLTGAIPIEVGNLGSLLQLNLAFNQLSGTIPAEIGNLSSLQLLTFSVNQLTGAIPAEVGNLSDLQNLWLASNQLTGTIPAEIGNLTNLTQLLLDGNSLTGSLPSELRNLQNIRNINLNNNPLIGAIPQSLTDLDYLAIETNYFIYSGTKICEPQNQEWLDWKTGRNIAGSGIVCGLTDLYVFRLEGIDAHIDPVTFTISLNLPGAEISATAAEFVVATGASVTIGGEPQVSGTTVNDFGQPLTYTITSEDGQASVDWRVNITNQSIVAGIIEQDYNALVAFYNATGGANWMNNTGWLEEGVEAKDWYGVGVSQNRVRNISLTGNNLSGSIPNEIGNLSVLQSLYLDNNNLSGVIPAEIGNLSFLQNLQLSFNQLSGAIPVEIGGLQVLTSLNLASNQLSGAIPQEIGNLSHLTFLSASSNQLSGAIPAEVGNLSKLISLFLGLNQLSGSIPKEIGNLSELRFLDLQNNLLSGSIPAEISGLSFLTTMRLSGNQLSGAIPEQIGNLSDLTSLHLANNLLSGTIPAEIGNLGAITSLLLNHNQLSGAIPAEIGNLIGLQFMSLHDNQLSGAIPSEIGNLGDLQFLQLFNNQLSGIIPSEIGNLASLTNLLLGNNNLTGSLPSELGNMQNLRSLSLNNNPLIGSIPLSLTSLAHLGSQGNYFGYGGTYLCEPEDQEWLDWKAGRNVTGSGATCNPTELYVFRLEGVDANINTWNSTITLNLPEADINGLVAEFVVFPGASVSIGGVPQISGTTPNDFTQPLIYTITSEDGQQSVDWVVTITNQSIVAGIFEQDYNALVALYNATDGANWTNKTGWLEEGENAGEWHGISVSDNRVVTISLAGNGLSGTIPHEIGNISKLQSLSLSSNQLSGTIPPEIGNLSDLKYLYLSSNQISGAIPFEIGNLAALKNLNLSGNELTGSIPTEISNLTSLTQILLSHNNLTGSLPAEIGALANLQTLWLTDNQLSGSIPAEIGNLTNLYGLLLGSNNLTGSLPKEIGALTKLENLWIGSNQLSGAIPAEIGNLTSLTQLLLDYNDLTGSLPKEIGALTNLETLSLQGNQLSGTIPAEIGALASLIDLMLNSNNLSGSLPPEMGNLQNLGSLNLNDNPLSGPMPQALTDLDYLANEFNFFSYTGTNLCEPQNQEWLDWKAGRNITGNGILCNTEGLLTFSLPGQSSLTINEASGTIAVLVEAGTDISNLVASFTLGQGANAYVNDLAQVSGTTANDFRQPVTYTVIAEDGISTQNWGVSVIIEQSITFEAITAKTFGEEPFALAATASSGMTVNYTSSNEQVATISGNTITIKGAGETTITASQPGNGNYTAATSVAQLLTVNKASQSITFGALAAKAFGAEPFALTATASSGLAVSYTSSNEEVATVSGNMVTIKGAGETTITASQPGNDNYTAATSVAQLLTVNTASQSITFGALPAKAFGAEPFALTATASSGMTVNYTSSNEQVATISGNTVTIKGAGETTITASQPGNGNYTAATSVAQLLTVNKASQSITFGALSAKAFGAEPFALAATASSGLTVTYTSSNQEVATISGNTVTIKGAGQTTITASQVGDGNYLAATSVAQQLTVNKASQSTTFEALAAKAFGAEPFALAATASSGLTVTYSSSNEQVATISGNMVTIKGAGETTITASQPGNGNYLAATSVAQLLTVNKASQSITFAALAAKAFGAEPFALAATASSGLTVTYGSSNEQVATISGNMVTIKGAGQTTITASQQGNGNYLAAQPVVQAFVVTPEQVDSRKGQIISFQLPTTLYVDEGPISLLGVSDSGLPIAYELKAGQASLDNNLLAFDGPGEISIVASQEGNDEFKPAQPVTATITVRPLMNISGKVVAQNGATVSGLVQAIQNGSGGGVKSGASLIDGAFLLTGLKDGDYLIKYIPNESSASQFFVTYYTSSPFWQQAQVVNLSNNAISNLELTAIPKSQTPSQQGSGRIKGRVVTAENTGNSRIVVGRLYEGGSPLENIAVYLLKSGEQAVFSEALTDSEGVFEMTGLPGGQYELLLDVPGIAMAPGSSVIDLDESKPIELTAFVGEEGIVTEISIVSSVSLEEALQINIYPNPVSDYLVVDYQDDDFTSRKMSIRLYSILGQELMADKIAVGKTLLDLRGYSPGMLLLTTFDEAGNLINQIKIKKE